MKTKRFTTLQLLCAALGGALLTLLAVLLTAWLVLGPQAAVLVEAWGMVQAKFIGDYDPDKAVDAALSGLVEGLGDRWSYYLDAEGYASQNQRRTNSYVGVGVTVSYENEAGLLILAVEPQAPAGKAGLSAGELIVAVDGLSLAGEARYEGSDRIVGEAGTDVTLTVRDAQGSEREVTMTREAVETNPVHSELLAGNVGCIRLDNFYSHSAQRLSDAADDLAARGARALVFDMRNNGGGYVDELTAMLDHLLPAGPIFRTEGKLGLESTVDSDENCIDLPMAVLVNANTYSAAELFAAQLQESVGAFIVGEPTSGKGYSQQAFPLTNGGAMNISTARYTTGAGVSLVGTGVRLDAEVYLEEEAASALASGTLDHADDAQLQKALELLG